MMGRRSLLPMVAVSFAIAAFPLAGCSKRPPSSPAMASGADAAAMPRELGSRPSLGEFRPNEALKDIHFDFDRYTLRSGDMKTLSQNAEWLRANPGNLLLIEGHADERGTNEYNLALGDRRAKSTKDYLVAHGVQASRVITVSYGKERPLCAEHGEHCWSQNRRAHFLVKAE